MKPRPIPGNMFQATEGRWGSREAEILRVAFLDKEQQPSFVFHTGDAMSMRLSVRAAHPLDDFVFGIGLFNADGVCCYGTNTYIEEMIPTRLAGDADVDLRDRHAGAGRRHLQAGRRDPQARRISRTTTTVSCTPSA